MIHSRARCVLCTTLLGLALLLPHTAAASWPVTLTNVPLCSVTSNQILPASVSDGAGGAIVAWTDSRNAAVDAYAQRISVDGTVQWAADGVPICATIGMQQYPVVVSDGAGGAIFVWRDTRSGGYYDLYAQRLSSGGVPQWTANGVELCAFVSDKLNFAVTADGSGGAVVAWRENRTGFGDDIYAQSITAAGAVQWGASGVVLCNAVRGQGAPAITSDGAGGAIVAWEDPRVDYTNYDIYAQRISAAGAVQWTANGVAVCAATGHQYGPTLVPDGANGAIFAWYDFRDGTWDTYAQRISAAGAVEWTANGVGLCTAAGHQMLPTLIEDGAGGAIVTWEDARTGYVQYDVYAQRISAAGAVQWTADGVALCTATNAQASPVVVADGAGGAIVTWQDYRNGGDIDVYAQLVSSAGVVQWAADGVLLSNATGDQAATTIVSDGAGGAIVTWDDYRAGNADIYAQRVWADGTTPVLLSFVSAEAGADGITLTWFAGGAENAVATVYRSAVAGEWAPIGEVTADGTGYMRYTDRRAPEADRVGYRLGILESGVVRFQGETWVERTALEFALNRLSPNPARGGNLTVHFTLANASPASLELLDVAGRRIAVHDVGALGAGRHSLELFADRRVAPGLYLVCLRQGRHTRVSRVAVLD